MSTLLRKVVLLGGGGAASLGLLTNLKTWWELSEASGNRADSHTNAKTLTDVNTVTSNPGIGGVGTAAQFTSANSESLRAGNLQALTSWLTADGTVVLWAYLDTKAADMTLFGTYSGAPDIQYITASDRFIATGTCASGHVFTATANNLGAVSTATWYMIAMRYKYQTSIEISVNGGAWDLTAWDTHDTLNTGGQRWTTLGVEQIVGTPFFNGRLAKAAIWHSAAGGGGALSNAQVTALYNGGVGLTYAGLT